MRFEKRGRVIAEGHTYLDVVRDAWVNAYPNRKVTLRTCAAFWVADVERMDKTTVEDLLAWAPSGLCPIDEVDEEKYEDELYAMSASMWAHACKHNQPQGRVTAIKQAHYKVLAFGPWSEQELALMYAADAGYALCGVSEVGE